MGMTNQRIKAIYSFRPDLLQKLYKAPIYDIATSIIAENKLPETCIFFDQPYRGQAATREWRDIRAKTIEYITKQNFRKLFYKPHPMCEADYFEDFAPLRPEFIQSSLPAEMIYEKIPTSTIISYTSTALFNIKMLAGVGLRSISLYPDFFETLDGSGGKAKNSLQRVFEDAGVEIVRLVDY